MFDFVAKHKRILQIVLFLTIIPFAFFGLESYTKSIGSTAGVASVDGTPITNASSPMNSAASRTGCAGCWAPAPT